MDAFLLNAMLQFQVMIFILRSRKSIGIKYHVEKIIDLPQNSRAFKYWHAVRRALVVELSYDFTINSFWMSYHFVTGILKDPIFSTGSFPLPLKETWKKSSLGEL